MTKTLTVTGVETIEITDPNGVCEKQRRQQAALNDPIAPDFLEQNPGTHVVHPGMPGFPRFPTSPVPSPINPIPLPEIGPWRRKQGPATYEYHDSRDDKEKWQVGLTGDPPGAVPFMATTGDPTQSEKWGNSARKYGNGDTKETQNRG